ncbi:hypothetical protein [Paenibacillus pini]|uniref:hypothetical protein n=1 Tax=Paenibacillus pini TaxID=669461 RepID=UPI00278C46BC|nr:hypothetical protein [Paenibacillus pini]
MDHVWLVGGGTHPGSGLPTIFESAQISVKLLEEEESRQRSKKQHVSRPSRSGRTV